jgi:hypothetical protein
VDGIFVVFTGMRTLADIHAEIERESERRTQLWHALGEGHDTALVNELKRLNEHIAELWEEHRATRAQMRFGNRARIVARARAEERLERAA